MSGKKEKLMAVVDITNAVGISRQRVLQLIEVGDLIAEKIGRNYVIRESDFNVWEKARREVGRPPKEKIATNQ